jgi:hypothetical protein
MSTFVTLFGTEVARNFIELLKGGFGELLGKIVGFFEVLVFEPEDERQALSAVMSVSMT